MGGIKVIPLSNACGAEILGVDLTKPMTRELALEINTAWLEHCVVLIRGQNPTGEQQINFCGAFGTVGDYLRPGSLRSQKMNERHRAVMFVSNILKNGEPIGTLPNGEMMFHTDTGYDQNPHKATTLCAIEIPDQGGNTIFSNQYLVFDALPKRLKNLLRDKKAKNAYEFGTMIKTKKNYSGKNIRSAVHPIIRMHTETGRMAVYVNELMTEKIIGLPSKESRNVLNEIYLLQKESRFCYEHIWQVGDLIMWDNRCTLHARTDFPNNQRRLLRRVTIEDSALN